MIPKRDKNDVQRERDEQQVVYSVRTKLNLADIEECITSKPIDGLWLYYEKRFDALGNAARGQRVELIDLGDFRELQVYQRPGYNLRPGERAQLERCTDPNRNTSS